MSEHPKHRWVLYEALGNEPPMWCLFYHKDLAGALYFTGNYIDVEGQKTPLFHIMSEFLDESCWGIEECLSWFSGSSMEGVAYCWGYDANETIIRMYYEKEARFDSRSPPEKGS